MTTQNQMRQRREQEMRLRARWYRKIAARGFEDVEQDPTDPVGPLKRWSGVDGSAITDTVARQEPLSEVVSSFPSSLIPRLERLLTSDSLGVCTESIAHRPNSRLKQAQVKAILDLVVKGKTERAIALRLSINDTAVHRCIEALREWSEFVESVEKVGIKSQGMRDSIKIVCRPLNATEDLPFVYATWRNCVWYAKHSEASSHRNGHDFETFVKRANEVITGILKKAQVKVACDEAQPSHVVGYSVSFGDHLEFVYVKANYRVNGIGKMLLPRPCSSVAKPFTNVGEAIVRNHPGKWRIGE